MIVIILSIILFVIFTILGSFHLYWFLGGIWGLEKVIPSKSEKASTISIPKFATLIVSATLFLFGVFYLIKSELIIVAMPNGIANYIYWFIPSVFILRAIGEFNYVGFFKKIKNTEFAKADTKLFSPLCLIIGFIGFIILLIH